MTRTVQIAAAALTLMIGAPVLAQAETSVALRVAPTARVETVKAQIEAKAEAFCRANPVGGTVAACRQDIEAQLSRAVEVHAEQYAKAHSNLVFAQR